MAPAPCQELRRDEVHPRGKVHPSPAHVGQQPWATAGLPSHRRLSKPQHSSLGSLQPPCQSEGTPAFLSTAGWWVQYKTPLRQGQHIIQSCLLSEPVLQGEFYGKSSREDCHRQWQLRRKGAKGLHALGIGAVMKEAMGWDHIFITIQDGFYPRVSAMTENIPPNAACLGQDVSLGTVQLSNPYPRMLEDWKYIYNWFCY